MTGALPAEPGVDPLPRVVRGRILELIKQDALRLPEKVKAGTAPPLDLLINGQPIVEGVVKLEPFIVTGKKPIKLPPRVKLTLDNFFNGDGTIAESAGGRISLSAGPTGKGQAAIKFNLRF